MGDRGARHSCSRAGVFFEDDRLLHHPGECDKRVTGCGDCERQDDEGLLELWRSGTAGSSAARILPGIEINHAGTGERSCPPCQVPWIPGGIPHA